MRDAERIANFGSWEWQPQADHVYWSEQLYRIFGVEPESFQPTFHAYIGLVHPDDREPLTGSVATAMRERRSFRLDHRIVLSDGEERAVRCYGEPLIDPQSGEVLKLIGVCQDITELMAAEAEQEVAAARFRSAFEHGPAGIALVEFDDQPGGVITDVNPAFCEITGRDAEHLRGSHLADLYLAEDAALDRPLWERLVAGEIPRYTVEKRSLVSDDRVIWLELSVSALPGGPGEVRNAIVQVQDVTERKRSDEQLRHVADHDSLTGLMNRRRFDEELASQIDLRKRYGGVGALLIFDVDGLKQINDTQGHGAGDLVLRYVAETVRARVRATDAAARLSGDEFAILLPSCSTDEALIVARDLLARVAGEDVAGGRVSMSVGVASFGEDVTSEDVIAEADAAMYRVKRAGGGGAGVAEEPVSSGRPRERDEALIERARVDLREGNLLLCAQPVIDLQSGEVDHNELLVRMKSESGDLLVASDFLAALARDRGFCQDLDRWVLSKAIEMLENDSRGSRLQVNLSAATLTDTDAVERLVGDLERSAAPPHLLGLEIDEAALGRDTERVTTALEKLAEAGCRIVLDGFNADFGSFEYLRLSLDQVKLAGSIVNGLLDHQADQSTLRAIVHLARVTETRTVAKLVESRAVIPILRMHGVDMAQGFALAEPAPVS